MYPLFRDQDVTASLTDVWQFLRNPANLDLITPEDLRFQIVSSVPATMFNGLIIEYRIKISGFGTRTWLAEIKHIREQHSFVDEQRIGPYRFWYHYHELVERGDTVKIIDRVYYDVPYGAVGRVLHYFFIRKTLERIFRFRRERLAEILCRNSK